MVARLSTLLCASGIAGSFTCQTPVVLESCAAYAIDLVGFSNLEMGPLA